MPDGSADIDGTLPTSDAAPSGRPGAAAMACEAASGAAAMAVDASSRAIRDARRWSGVPIAISLALVGFSILFGVYGPRVVDRGTPSIGTPLWEAADAAVEYLDWFTLHGGTENQEQIAAGEVNAGLMEILRVPTVCPDLSTHDFHPLRPQAFDLPGAKAAAVVVFARGNGNQREFLSLVIAPFHEQYTLLTEFGQPRFLAPGGAVGVEAAPSDRVSSMALAWTNGSLVFVAVGSRKTTLGDVAPDLVPTMAGMTEGS